MGNSLLAVRGINHKYIVVGKEKIRHERKDVDHGHFSGIYRRSLDLAESAEPEEIDRT